MTAIIFGAAGQDGFYLTELLQEQQIEVIGVSRSGNFNRTDIADFIQVNELIKKYQPAYIFHLAANSTASHEAQFENHSTISTGTLNILESVKNSSPGTKVFISGSALQFKNEQLPIKESDAFEARDAYSVSRIQSVYAARYFRSLGIKTYVGYFFHHDSPRRTERHMAKKIAEACKRYANGSKEKLMIGDITAVKEWTFAGDAMRAVWTLVQQEEIFEANIGTGIGHSIEDWLNACAAMAGINWHEFVVIDHSYRSAIRTITAAPTVIFSLGWKPATSFDELARMMMN
ncbi:MAG: GDP-mannose 4,6-dehydratase [Chitinophagaceae bacterium]|nr:GDP-mannose 4,6-dehydratase [Chitinophagaceae bacterium]